MGRGNAEPSAKNSEEHNWKTLPGLVPSLISRRYMKAQKRSMIQVLFTTALLMRSSQDNGSPANAEWASER